MNVGKGATKQKVNLPLEQTKPVQRCNLVVVVTTILAAAVGPRVGAGCAAVQAGRGLVKAWSGLAGLGLGKAAQHRHPLRHRHRHQGIICREKGVQLANAHGHMACVFEVLALGGADANKFLLQFHKNTHTHTQVYMYI